MVQRHLPERRYVAPMHCSRPAETLPPARYRNKRKAVEQFPVIMLTRSLILRQDLPPEPRTIPMNGAELLVAALENEGVKQIFGVRGEENLDVVEALRRSSIKLVVTRHEQAAAFMAATHGRLTGEPGVCISTLGPGALNFSTGAAYALLGAMPMIMITGQKGILSSRQARFQIVDIVAAMKPLTKLTRQVVSATMIPTLVREAFRVARS